MYAFELALSHAKQGGRISREGWNGKGMHVEINKGGATLDGVHLPYLMMFTVDKTYVPWLASQTDLLANDWVLLPPIVRVAHPQTHQTTVTKI